MGSVDPTNLEVAGRQGPRSGARGAARTAGAGASGTGAVEPVGGNPLRLDLDPVHLANEFVERLGDVAIGNDEEVVDHVTLVALDRARLVDRRAQFLVLLTTYSYYILFMNGLDLYESL